jgi:hypothetical protein
MDADGHEWIPLFAFICVHSWLRKSPQKNKVRTERSTVQDSRNPSPELSRAIEGKGEEEPRTDKMDTNAKVPGSLLGSIRVYSWLVPFNF